MASLRTSQLVSMTVGDPAGTPARGAVEELLRSLRAKAGQQDRVRIDRLCQLLRDGGEVVVSVADAAADLSPQQAADRLGVSRQHLVRLMDAGRIPYLTLPESQRRRVALRDLDAYALRQGERRQRARALGASLRELDDLSE